ncbi:hypothetical protein KKA17_08150 [bacterium]|nr:hypothetical protein [bacterium]
MFKGFVFVLLFLVNADASDYPLIPFTHNNAFDYFASLILWLLIISVPFFALVGLFKSLKDK